MIDYTIYIQNGQIVRNGFCSDEDYNIQAQANEFIIQGTYNCLTQYIKNNVVLDIPTKPSGFVIFDYIQEKWIPDENAASSSVNAQRNSLLAASDWTQLPDVPLTNKPEWATYRQALRDVPQQPGYPLNVIWPVQPV